MDEDVHTEEGSIPRDFAEWRPNPEQLYGQSELSDILRKTIQGLPPGFRTVFTLRDVENLSTEETAEALGIERALRLNHVFSGPAFSFASASAAISKPRRRVRRHDLH